MGLDGLQFIGAPENIIDFLNRAAPDIAGRNG